MHGESFLGGFNAASPDEAAAALLACCASRRWAAGVVAGRPYRDFAHLEATADALLAGLDWADVREAVDAHPRIGERPEGGGREAGWSRDEQSAAVTPDEGVRAELRAGNAEYERRFGHVFLIRAAGLPAGAVLAALRRRLGNDAAAERDEVRAQLRGIAALRLAKLVGA